MASDVVRYVIVGNGIAGTTAAETLRRNDPNCHISLFTDEPYPLYNRVALPPALKLEKPLAKVFLKTVEFHRERNICFYPGTRVVGLDLRAKTIALQDGREAPYDRLLIATGGTPNRLNAPGADADGVCYFQTYDDTADMLERIVKAERAVAVGGSYIAYELAEAFSRRGLQVTWLIRGPHFLHRVLDEDGGAVVDALARRHGVEMVYRDTVDHLETRDGRVEAVVTTQGRRAQADLVGCGLGLHINHDFLPRDRFQIRDGVVTNEYLETGVEDVFAAGDMAEAYDTELDVNYRMGTWASATTHGRIAAINLAGGHQPVTELPNYTSTLFDSRLTVLGATPETRPDLQSVSETAPPRHGDDWAYRRLFFLDGRLVGAVLIGDMHARVELIRTIRSREPAWAERQQLLRL